MCYLVSNAGHVQQENAIRYSVPGLKPSNGMLPQAFLYLAGTQPSGLASHFSCLGGSHISAKAKYNVDKM